jgi:UDP-N-acetylmuramoyl-tripeptide--D-alanyl-D-alanine ligase
MIELTEETIKKALNLVHCAEAFSIKGVSVDTRTLVPGNLFVALPGEHCDGHHCCQDAEKQGCSAVLVSKNVSVDVPVVHVVDTLKSLGLLAGFWRDQFSLPVIAVTGSNGKTTVKNMIANILKVACNTANAVLSTHGNFNNHIGLPLTLCRLNEHHRYAVVEMGMSHFGEIDYLTRLAKPTISLITSIFPCHLEGVGNTLEGVAKAKTEIFKASSDEGVAILNADDSFFQYCRERIGGKKLLTFSIGSQADVMAKNVRLLSDVSLFDLVVGKEELTIKVPLPGEHNVYNALAAVSACLAAGVELSMMKKGLQTLLPTSQRLEFKKGFNDCAVIDDSYNANPISLARAVDVLERQEHEKILVVGDMKGLGDSEVDFHIKAGEMLNTKSIDTVFTIGELAKHISIAYRGNKQHFETKADLIDALKLRCSPELIILVKASSGMRLEDVVQGICR